MDSIARATAYAASHLQELRAAIGQHLLLVGIALAVSLVLGVPLGIASARSKLLSTVFLNTANTLRVVPSLAILFLALPYFGLSLASPLIALSVLALPPIILNTDVAMRVIPPAVREAGIGMGMSSGQLFRRVEFPIALPVVLSGIRTATVEVIASATLAAFIGGGGLGIYITRGFAMYDPAILLVGAVPVSMLAIVAEVFFGFIQNKVQVL